METTNGQVYKATRTKDGKLVALKCIKQEDGDGKGFPVTAIREMRILRQLKHKVNARNTLNLFTHNFCLEYHNRE